MRSKFVFGVCTILCIFYYTEGLRCWSCQNQSIGGCVKRGKPEQCDENEQTCTTVLRYITRFDKVVPFVVKTGCKQMTACISDELQNSAASNARDQCSRGKPGSVCRCCCNGPLCNRRARALHCAIKKPRKKFYDVAPGDSIEGKLERTCPEYPEAPEGGKRFCSGGYSLRAYCKFTCDEGCSMVGGDMTICVKRGKDYVWNREPPKCVKNDVCPDFPTAPKHGIMECTGEGELGTVCGFACNFGYSLHGPSSTTCSKTGDLAAWSDQTPLCLPYCDLTSIPSPRNGARTCIGEGTIGTSCTFQCDAGYRMDGEVLTTCLLTGEGGRWSELAPECLAVCRKRLRAPKKGSMTCRGGGVAGSTCSFKCEKNYRLIGREESVCIEIANGAIWNANPPVCEPFCEREPRSPHFGDMQCSGKILGAECLFQCRVGFRLVGETSTKCVRVRESATWDKETPVCEPICEDMPPQSPRYGNVACTGEGELGTVCDYRCEIGFRLEGVQAKECVRINEAEASWSSAPPVCTPICHVMPEQPENGKMVCDGNGDVGTTCSFQCNEDYEIAGQEMMACQQQDGRAIWSNEAPICKLIPTCEMMEAPKNGRVRCNGAGKLGTKCSFFCDMHHRRIGQETSICIRDGDNAYWSEAKVTCKEIEPECQQISDFHHGRVVCDSDILRKGTNCRYECTEPSYQLLSDHGSVTQCVGQKRNLTWNFKKPCCVECKNVKKDIIIAMDSSGSIGPKDWENMKTFVQNIVRRFNVSKNDVQFCVFQFSTVTRSEGWMYFGRYKKNQLIQQIGRMKRMGSGTRTGLALEYAKKRFRDRGNRKNVGDMVWVFTDGATEDMDELKVVAEELRQDDVEILALAINPTDNFVGQMSKMTGSRDKVLLAPNMQSLGEDLVNRIAVKICQKSCPA